MEHEYEKWNKVKQELSKVPGAPFEERQIWWTSVGYNLGNESYGKNQLFERPVLVFRKLSADSFVGIPFTTTKYVGSYFYEYDNVFFDELGVEQIQKTYLMLHQARIFSKKRLIRRISRMSDFYFEEIREKYLKLFLGKKLQIERPAFAGQSRIPNGKDDLSITPPQNLSSSQGLIDLVKYKQMKEYTCGPAVLKILFKYFNLDLSEDKLEILCKANDATGTSIENMSLVAQSFGFKTEINNFSEFNNIQYWLDKKIPVVVDWITKGKDLSDNNVAEGHYSIVVGLDTKSIYLLDTDLGDIRKISQENFYKVWFDFASKNINAWQDMIIRQIFVIYKE